MQRFFIILALLLIPFSAAWCQDAPTDKINAEATPPPISKPGRDFIMIDFLYNHWINVPDTVKTRSFGYAFNASFCYDFPIKKTKLSFAAGLGINTQVVYLNQQVIVNTDTYSASGYSSQAHFVPDSAGFKRYKFVTTYIQAPFELRYYSNTNNRNRAWKAAVGLYIGTLLGSHTKATTSVDGTTAVYKVNTRRYVTPWNFAAVGRVGYGNFSLFGSVNLTTVFKVGAGPPATPFTVGICLSGL